MPEYQVIANKVVGGKGNLHKGDVVELSEEDAHGAFWRTRVQPIARLKPAAEKQPPAPEQTQQPEQPPALTPPATIAPPAATQQRGGNSNRR